MLNSKCRMVMQIQHLYKMPATFRDYLLWITFLPIMLCSAE
jgi:hypothetical protein